MSEWTLLTNHALVLSHIARDPSMTALEIAQAIGITERSIRKIIAELLDEGYISKKKVGRCNRYRVNPDIPLRHHTHGETAVGDLLKALGWKKR